jgi:hypothetical protein
LSQFRIRTIMILIVAVALACWFVRPFFEDQFGFGLLGPVFIAPILFVLLGILIAAVHIGVVERREEAQRALRFQGLQKPTAGGGAFAEDPALGRRLETPSRSFESGPEFGPSRHQLRL